MVDGLPRNMYGLYIQVPYLWLHPCPQAAQAGLDLQVAGHRRWRGRRRGFALCFTPRLCDERRGRGRGRPSHGADAGEAGGERVAGAEAGEAVGLSRGAIQLYIRVECEGQK